MNRRSIVAARVSRKAVWGGEVRRVAGLAAVLSLTVLIAACGDLTRQGTASSYLIINSLQATAGADGTPSTTLQSDVRSDDGTIFSDSGVVDAAAGDEGSDISHRADHRQLHHD